MTEDLQIIAYGDGLSAWGESAGAAKKIFSKKVDKEVKVC